MTETQTPPKILMPWVPDDGGRAAAGFRGKAGDCATRAFTIARFGPNPTGRQYRSVYDDLARLLRDWAFSGRTSKHKEMYRSGRFPCTPRDGMMPAPLHRYAAEIGWSWTPAKHIGQAATTHMVSAELPPGSLVVVQAKHYAAVVDGVVYDTWDSTVSRTAGHGKRMVYGWWRP